MLVFTGPDKALLDRTARMLDDKAKALAWESVEDSKKRKQAKLEYDRLKRDSHDLRCMGLRLKKVAKTVAADIESRKTPGQVPGMMTGADERGLAKV